MSKVLDKIDSYLNVLDEKEKQKNKKGKEVPFLYKTEEYQHLSEGDKEAYKKVFNALAKEMGFDPEDVENLPDEKKKKFFNALDKKWKADKETD